MELFKNPHDAILFAIRFSSQQYAQSQMSKSMRSGGEARSAGSGKGLVSLDGAATAGLIKARIDKLPPLYRACVIARFSARTEDCPCCGNQKMLTEYKEAVLTLVKWADDFVSGSSSAQRLLFDVVNAYFDRSLNITDLAKKAGVAKSTAHDQKSKIWPNLTKMDKEAMTAAGDYLESMIGEMGD